MFGHIATVAKSISTAFAYEDEEDMINSHHLASNFQTINDIPMDMTGV